MAFTCGNTKLSGVGEDRRTMSEDGGDRRRERAARDRGLRSAGHPGTGRGDTIREPAQKRFEREGRRPVRTAAAVLSGVRGAG